MAKKIFFVWLSNTTDHRDDEPLKVLASSKDEAKEIASNHLSCRFLIRDVYTRQEFKRLDPGWHALMWSSKAYTD